MEKLFIFGIGGLTGHKLTLLAKNDFNVYGSYNLRNPNFDFVKASKVDITDKERLEEILSSSDPDIIVNACALNNVDYCESHNAEAKKVNIDAVENMYEISNSLGIKLIHISSDSVFDGKKDKPYVESDTPNPINFYGHTKLAGEKIVLQNPNNLIIRASVLYGLLPNYIPTNISSSMKPSNFVQWLISKLKAKENVKIITDELSSPIIVDDFAKSILHLILGNYKGLFHSAPSIQITRYDFSKKLAECLKLENKLIQPTTNKELGRNVVTGSNKCLDSSKIRTETGFNFLSLEGSFDLLKIQMNS